MKRFFFFLVSIITLYLCSCQKNDIQKPTADNNYKSSESFSSLTKNNTDLITAHPWMYGGYYFHYIDQAHKGDPQYIRGAGNNIIDLNYTRIQYKKNGTFVELDGGYRYPGTWYFTNNADTAFVMMYSYSTSTTANTIVALNKNQLYYTHPIGSYSHNNFAYTELIPAAQ